MLSVDLVQCNATVGEACASNIPFVNTEQFHVVGSFLLLKENVGLATFSFLKDFQ